MFNKIHPVVQGYLRISFSLLLSIFSCRLFEYFAIASKSFVTNAYRYELAGLFYDIWFWLIYSFIFLCLYIILYFLNKRIAVIIIHCINILFFVSYISLLITFSERNTPFDHELFTRNSKDTLLTIQQMMTTGIVVYLPYFAILSLYLLINIWMIKLRDLSKNGTLGLLIIASLAVIFIRFANPSQDHYKQKNAYYLVCNKFGFWIQDSYKYFSNLKEKEKVDNAQLKKEIIFYQKNQPFQFTSSEYPLLRRNNEPDVLGGFFKLQAEPPNIVVLVVEGLSRDFSGDGAFAGSFTPFLDSLSKHSLVWDNFLSTAPGTFAAHPAISGSLPYGKRGFSIMPIMPDHLSLIKILKASGYTTRFMIGFNPDFDNMGGYIRQQGTDFILSHYGSKYKEMGVGEEGWSMGYPDDALYSRSFEVMDSIKQTPYLHIYHTATTHLPYLFAQKNKYHKLFDQKLKKMNVSADIRRTLQQTKQVLSTFMFSDDCMQQFFKVYAGRPDYRNTLFIITGDHHIGSFPALGEIDDYHVPFIMYSPLLKSAQKFLSVNTHNNITPTLLALLSNKYPFLIKPSEVHWLGGVMDTSVSFRNMQSMAFMSWSREINDYIYQNYFLSGDQLYKINKDLIQEKCKNDSVRNHMIKLRENFKVINGYVCDSNKVYPGNHNILPGKKELLFVYTDSATKTIFSKRSDTSLMPLFKIPEGYRYLSVVFSAQVNMNQTDPATYPTLRFALVDTKGGGLRFLYWSKRDIATLSAEPFRAKGWNEVSTNDLFTLRDYIKVKSLYFDLAVFGAPAIINCKIAKLTLRIYGIQ